MATTTMGNHLNIGPGIGEAATWDSTPAIQQFANVLANKKAEQARKDQELINQASQLRPDQIRDADKSDYYNKYNDWKNSQINANQLPQNSRQRLDALAQAQQKYNDLGSFINESKKEAANEHGLAQQWVGNQHLFADDAHQKFMKSMQAPMSSSDFVPGNQYQNFQRYIDHAKVDDAVDKTHKELLKQSEWSNPIQSQGIDKQGNKTGVVVHNERAVDPSDLLSTDAHLYDTSDDVKASVDSRYHNIVGSTPQETKMLRIKQLLIDKGDLTQDKDGNLVSGVSEKTKPTFKANAIPDRFYAHYDYRLQNPIGTSNQLTPTQSIAQATMNGNPADHVEQLKAMIPQEQYNGGQIQSNIDPKTGNHVFTFPAKQVANVKNIEAYNQAKANYDKNPSLTGWPLISSDRKPIPFEEAKADWIKAHPQYTPDKSQPTQRTYQLKPPVTQDDREAYLSSYARMLKDQGANQTDVDKILGGKGNRGLNSVVTTPVKPTTAKSPTKIIVPKEKLY